MSWQKLTTEQLEALPTARLLNIYKQARTALSRLQSNCPCYYGYYPRCECNVEDSRAAQIKAILDSREHVGEQRVTAATRDPHLRRTLEKAGRKHRPAQRSDLSWSERRAVGDGVAVITKDGNVRPAFGSITDLHGAVGRQVYKTSKKPFKSKSVYNTVSGVTVNPHTNRAAFTFEEDDSIVDAHICSLRNKK